MSKKTKKLKGMTGSVVIRKIVKPSKVILKLKKREITPYKPTYFKEEIEELEESLFS